MLGVRMPTEYALIKSLNGQLRGVNQLILSAAASRTQSELVEKSALKIFPGVLVRIRFSNGFSFPYCGLPFTRQSTESLCITATAS